MPLIALIYVEKIVYAEICDYLHKNIRENEGVMLLHMMRNKRHLLELKGKSADLSIKPLKKLQKEWKSEF